MKNNLPNSRHAWRLLAALTTLLCACGGQDHDAAPGQSPPLPASASQPAAGIDRPFVDERSYSNRGDAALNDASEAAAVVHRQIMVGGRTLPYTATTGHLSATDRDTGKRASMFYVAYSVDNIDPVRRPVTFLFNGGPVTASVWLHLGSWGPKRISTETRAADGSSYPLIDSSDSLLDQTDLVFVDAVGSGYSQAIAPSVNRDFWGVDADATVFRDFISRYVAVNGRGASPIYLYGESYGGIRAGVLADLLETAGIKVSGVVLNSPILNFNTACDLGAPDCTGFVPTYAAVSTYHRVSNKPEAMSPADYIEQARRFSIDAYRPALRASIDLGTAPSIALLSALNGYTGLASSLWANHLNLTPDIYSVNVKPGYVVDINDGRLATPAGGDWSDPYSDAFESHIRTLLPGFLGYRSGSTYSMAAGDSWQWTHDGLPLPDAIPDLASALTQNPDMKILALNGYHDLNCPFFQTDLELARIGKMSQVRSYTFAGGHMTYLTEASPEPLRQALRDFYGHPGAGS
ncbi:hypothetical protein BZL54_10260 [Burkholderia ubonensis subsp. mesacidophila]|uniref:Peptidase S10 n=2 Tax=Burkholderia ubonensis TaxID=101571 RepID=A0A2A4FJ03_9BURK|nr:hypothetical protein BZL54_10260 [Burkholderia ubonensis subsp. mesacidophila]